MALSTSTGSKRFTLRLQEPDRLEVTPYRGIEIAERILSRCVSGKTLVYFDPDTDGLVAGLFICMVLQKRGIKYSTYVNSNRAHGFMLTGEDVQGWTVINGDFLVTREIARDLVESGASLLSFDHHECEPDFIHEIPSAYKSSPGITKGDDGVYHGVPDGCPEAVVINNQYPFEQDNWRFQSGAGVTYESLKQLHPDLETMTNRALVGMTILTDIRDLEAPGAWSYLWDMKNHKYEGYIKHLIYETSRGKNYSFGVPRLDKGFVEYTVSPALNSLFRFNEEEAAVDFILGASYPSTDYQRRQRDLVKSLVNKAAIRDYGSLVVIEIDARDHSPSHAAYISNFVGLVCSRYTGNGKSAIGYCIDWYGKVERASFRGNIADAPYREKMLDHIEGIGHSMAFGIKNLVPSDSLWKTLNEVCKEAEGEASLKDIFVDISNMSSFVSSPASVIAEKNSFRNGSNQIYIRYTGSHVVDVRHTERFQEYKLNGVSVKCFDSSLSPTRDLILPTIERGRPVFFLQKAFNKDFSERHSISEFENPTLP